MKQTRILGLRIVNRANNSIEIQDILTKFGCSIKTRLGIHDLVDDYCSTSSIILLELTGDLIECDKLENELSKVNGLEIQKMVFQD